MSETLRSGSDWLTPPPLVDLHDNEVHVWLVREGDSPISEELEPVLSSAERDRALRFKFPGGRRRYLVSHAALRLILARYVELPAAQLEFCENAFGKPELASSFRGPALSFNLTHSHDAALIAIARNRQIGIDIEYIKREFRWREIVEHFFAPGEVATLFALPPALQQRAFFTCWTRKEAYIKAKGGGLSIPLQEFEVTLAPGEPPALRRHQIHAQETQRWTFLEIDAGSDYAAAVAVEGGYCMLKCFRWSGLST